MTQPPNRTYVLQHGTSRSGRVTSVENRSFRKMGRSVGVIGLGAWQLGADWGEVSEGDAHATLQAAVDAGVTFIDTADVYGDGRSEQIIGSFVADKPQLT